MKYVIPVLSIALAVALPQLNNSSIYFLRYYLL